MIIRMDNDRVVMSITIAGVVVVGIDMPMIVVVADDSDRMSVIVIVPCVNADASRADLYRIIRERCCVGERK